MIRLFLLAVLLLALGGCAQIELPVNLFPASPTAAPTATYTPPPPTATSRAATPAVVVDLPAPRCPIAATRTPPPGAPTYIPGGPVNRTGVVDPHVELCASASTIRVGETLTLTGLVVDVGLPYYSLLVRDETMPDWARMLEVTYENRLRFQNKEVGPFELVSFQAAMREVVLTLRARRAANVQVRIFAGGEIHYGYPGPAISGSGGSDPARITIRE